MISVLMPAYNAASYIRPAIDSILSQDYRNFELLIADDCSTDNTRAIIDSYSDDRIKTYHNAENLRKPLTVQKLFIFSTGDLVTIHDADDVSLPERFGEIVNVFKTQPDIYMCGHSIERISERGEPLGLYRMKVSNYEEIKRQMSSENTDGDPSMFIRREVLENLGEIFRPFFMNNMDYDLALRIIEKYRTTNLPQVLSYYRNVPNSISKGILNHKKLITQDITRYLANERRNGGLDALQRNDLDTLKRIEEEFSAPYLKDRTLHFRKMAEFFMYCKMNSHAIKYMLMAVKQEPLKWINWRTLQYCVRKTYLGI